MGIEGKKSKKRRGEVELVDECEEISRYRIAINIGPRRNTVGQVVERSTERIKQGKAQDANLSFVGILLSNTG